jgi:hypothetical protein
MGQSTTGDRRRAWFDRGVQAASMSLRVELDEPDEIDDRPGSLQDVSVLSGFARPN